MDELISTTYASSINRSGSMSVDLSRIRDILDICSASDHKPVIQSGDTDPALPVASHQYTESSQWTRLSRRPSVDQPDDEGSPAPNQHSDSTELRGSIGAPPIEHNDLPIQPTPLINNPSVPVNSSEIPAHLFFNGISQDESNWWTAFESYDPDWLHC